MSINAITAQDTLSLFDQVISDFSDGDVSTITFPNEISALKTGKNRNTIYTENQTGNNAVLVARLVMNSNNDRLFNARMIQQLQDMAAFTLINGQFVKRVGDGQGNVGRNVYTLSGGIFTKKVETKENVEGDTEQGTCIYTITFANAARSIE